jgi:hypothetical protein
LFILAAIALRASSVPDASRRRLMRLVVLSYAAMLVFASAQTIAGRAPADPTFWSLGLALSLVALAMALARAARGFDAGAAAEPVEVAKVA